MDWSRKLAGVPVWGWGAMVLGVGGVMIYRRHKAAQAAAAGTSQGGGVGAAYAANAIDPATGVPYSTELAQAQQQVPTSSVTTPSGASYTGPASGIGQVLAELQPGQVAPTSSTPEAPPTYTPASAFAHVGQAFASYPDAQVVTPQGTFYPVNPQEAQGITNQGGTLYYFPTPGVAAPATGVPFTQPTPLYGQVPS